MFRCLNVAYGIEDDITCVAYGIEDDITCFDEGIEDDITCVDEGIEDDITCVDEGNLQEKEFNQITDAPKSISQDENTDHLLR